MMFVSEDCQAVMQLPSYDSFAFYGIHVNCRVEEQLNCRILEYLMRRSLTYSDAVKILGDNESVLPELLDRVSAIGVFTVGGINLVALCNEFIRLGKKLVSRLGDQFRGADRTTRTERVHAAHSVIVITAFFDTLNEALEKFPPGRRLRVNSDKQISMAGGQGSGAEWGRLVQVLADTDIPRFARAQAPEEVVGEVELFYRYLAGSVFAFMHGPSNWDDAGEADRERFIEQLDGLLPGAAVLKYEELFRRLAMDCPEFGIWVDLSSGASTRSELRSGLKYLEDLLAGVSCGQLPNQRRAALAHAYQAALDKPITTGGESNTRLRLPALGQGYVDHRFRVVEMSPSSEPARESWWATVPVRDDICRFLAGFLISAGSWEAPLVVLGQPGSGKSVLTRILTARLPASDFLPVRVELRQVPAEADLQTQIEHAIRAATGEQLSWPRLAESCRGAVPVILLDGFDELLQATGVAQTDFLLRVAAFQEREADQGRPLAVIVTSRTAVIDRARMPGSGLVIRLEPFNDSQVIAWLDIWQRLNMAQLAQRSLRPLPASTALAHRELAEQPLLLLMLAMYDADANALQHMSAGLGRTELYERLVGEFAHREVSKHVGALGDSDLARAVEAEFLRLSVTAFAMFNRRSQWVSDGDLDADLSALHIVPGQDRRDLSMRAPLTAAQLAVGRFFFVHESQATSDGRLLHTYEFLHATIEEYLVARLVVRVLTDMAARESVTSGTLPRGVPEDGLLHALLSYAVLTARNPVISFVADLLDKMDPPQRQTLASLLIELHSRALYPRTESTHDGYQPRDATITERHAAWSANLLVLAVLAAGEITGTQLFGVKSDPAAVWRSQAMMWRAQLFGEEWEGLYDTIDLTRLWNGTRRDIRLRRIDGDPVIPAADIYWTHIIPPGRPDRNVSLTTITAVPQRDLRRANFMCGRAEDDMSHALEPLGVLGKVFVNVSDGHPASAANALLAALTEPFKNPSTAGKVYKELAQVTSILAESATFGEDVGAYIEAALNVLVTAVERGIAPQDLLEPIASIQAKKSRSNRGVPTISTYQTSPHSSQEESSE